MFWFWTLTSFMFVAVNNLSSVAHLNTPHKIVCMYGFEKELGIWFLIVLPINGYPWYLLQNGYPWCKKWLSLCFHVWTLRVCPNLKNPPWPQTFNLISFTEIDFVKLNIKWSMFECVHVKSELNNRFHAKVNSRDKSSKI